MNQSIIWDSPINRIQSCDCYFALMHFDQNTLTLYLARHRMYCLWLHLIILKIAIQQMIIILYMENRNQRSSFRIHSRIRLVINWEPKNSRNSRKLLKTKDEQMILLNLNLLMTVNFVHCNKHIWNIWITVIKVFTITI